MGKRELIALLNLSSCNENIARDFVAARHAFRTAKEKIIICMRNEVSEWTNQIKSAHICSSDIIAVFVFEKEYGKQGKGGLCES